MASTNGNNTSGPGWLLTLIVGHRPEPDRLAIQPRPWMTEGMAAPAVVEDQGRLLEDALVQVRQQTQLMRRCLETPGKLMDALKHRYIDFFLLIIG